MNSNAITWIVQSKRALIIQPSFSFYIILFMLSPTLHTSFIFKALRFHLANAMLLHCKRTAITS